MKRSVIQLLVVFILAPLFAFTQHTGWSKEETANYKNIKSICEYYQGKTYDSTQRALVFNKFIYFDNILNDTSEQRKNYRMQKFDILFSILLHFVDSVGLENLDAKPTRYFNEDSTYFQPFVEGAELQAALPMCLTYFDKRRANIPLGTLLFEDTTHKLYSWIILSQGGYYYFLTFNLW